MAKLVARLHATAALWVRIQTSLKKKTKLATKAKEWPTHSSPTIRFQNKFLLIFIFQTSKRFHLRHLHRLLWAKLVKPLLKEHAVYLAVSGRNTVNSKKKYLQFGQYFGFLSPFCCARAFAVLFFL
jgi:hypothetical protein